MKRRNYKKELSQLEKLLFKMAKAEIKKTYDYIGHGYIVETLTSDTRGYRFRAKNTGGEWEYPTILYLHDGCCIKTKCTKEVYESGLKLNK